MRTFVRITESLRIDTCDKGIFPHLFNIRDNQTYVRLLPNISYYVPETMQAKERECFLM